MANAVSSSRSASESDTEDASDKGLSKLQMELKKPDRRLRLVPFAVMMLIGIVAAWLWDNQIRNAAG